MFNELKLTVMRGCLNVFWYFPLFGFFHALIYVIMGAILCCTVILYPIGLGYFQIARYLLSPFSSALVSRADLLLVRPQDATDEKSFSDTYTKIIGVLFIPFGLIASAYAVLGIINCCLYIVTIPCVYVWTRALPAIFNPTGKVCVPIAVADEITRIKNGQTVAKFKGDSPTVTEEAVAMNTGTANTYGRCETPQNSPEKRVRDYDESQLQEIVNNPTMYNAQMVESCRKEIAIREESKAFEDQIKTFDNDRLSEILKNSALYSEAMIYVAERELAERIRLRDEQLEREAAEARALREQAAAAKREQQRLWLKKNAKWLILVATIVLVLLISLVCYKITDNRRRQQIARENIKVHLIKVYNARAQIYDYYQKITDLLSAVNAQDRKSFRKETKAVIGVTDQVTEDAYTIARDTQYLRNVAGFERIATKIQEQSGIIEPEIEKIQKAYEQIKERAAVEKVARAKREEEARIAAEKRAEEARIAAEKRAEEERIAAKKRAKAAQIASWQREEEARVARKLKAGEGRDGGYQVGDYYNQGGKKGIVFEVNSGGRHGKIVSVVYTTGVWNHVNNWCKSLGAGWRLPSLSELQNIYYVRNNKISKVRGDFWSSTSAGNDQAKGLVILDQRANIHTMKKTMHAYARAVCEF